MTQSKRQWTFLTNHSHVLFLIKKHSSITVREMALNIGITERAVVGIINDLVDAGFLDVEKIGRNNHYQINDALSLRHDLESHCTIGQLLGALHV